MRKLFRDWVLDPYQTLLEKVLERWPRKSDSRINYPRGESDLLENITVRLPRDQGASPTPKKPEEHPDSKIMVDWQRFRQAYVEARETFVPQEGVLGVGFGSRLIESHKKEEEPIIIILVRRQLQTRSFPPDFQGFKIIAREPYVEPDEDRQKSNTSHTDLSIIDWVKVHRIRKTVTPYFAPPSTVRTTTVGQVFVIEDSQANARGESALVPDPSITGFTAIDWVQAYEYFRQTWKDDYDFVAMYVDLPSGMPNLNNHQRTVFNAVTGINHKDGDYYNQRPGWGSDRLLGIQMMPKDQYSLTNAPNDPLSIRDRAARNTRLHELSHQWGAYVLPNVFSDSNYFHWLVKSHSDLSPLSDSPNDWLSNSPGSFQEQYVPPDTAAYSPLDLYLMGMLPPGDPQLSSFYYIDNLSPPDLRGSRYVHTGSQVNLMVQNIVAMHRPRQPDAANSQRSFRQAFVLLTKDLNLTRDPTKPYVGVLLAEIIDKERIAHTTEFRSSTESHSVLDTYLYADPYDGIYIKDNPSDTGTEPTSGTFWDSPDIWVRNADDGGTSHEDTLRGQDNYIYVRVRNNGTQPSGEITVNVFRANFAGTEFLYPEDWRWDEDRVGSQIIVSAPAGGEVVARFKWDLNKIPPAAGWHPCLLAEVLPIHRTQTQLRHVWEDRRIAQKNITIVDPPSGAQPLSFHFSIGVRSLPDRWVRVRVQQKEGDPAAEVELDLGDEDWLSRLSKASFLEGARAYAKNDRPAHLDALATDGRVVEREGRSHFVISDPFRGGHIALPLLEAERKELTLKVHWGGKPPTNGARFQITQLNDQDKVVGGVDLVIRRRGLLARIASKIRRLFGI